MKLNNKVIQILKKNTQNGPKIYVFFYSFSIDIYFFKINKIQFETKIFDKIDTLIVLF
jgi:hypothetical protein